MGIQPQNLNKTSSTHVPYIGIYHNHNIKISRTN